MMNLTKGFLLMMSVALCTITSAQGIQFEESTWQEAMAKAKEQNKLMFVDSYAKWCGPCKRMAKNEFVKEDVGNVYNANFVNLKLDMETKNGRTFGSKYPVSAYPTMFFLDGEGKVVKKIKGGKKGEQLISMAKAVLKSHDTSGQFKEKYDEGDRSYEIVYSYVEALNKASKPSLKISHDYLKSNPDITDDQRLKFLYVATVDADSKIFEKMVENKESIIGLVGEDDYNNKVKTACTNTMLKAIEFETESLYEEALLKAEDNLTKDKKIFVAETAWHYADAMKDNVGYMETAKDLCKLYLKSDPKRVGYLVDNIQKNYPTKEDMIEMTIGFAKKYYKKEKGNNSALVYIKSLILGKDYEKAQKVLDDALKRANKKGEETKSLSRVQNILSKKLKAK